MKNIFSHGANTVQAFGVGQKSSCWQFSIYLFFLSKVLRQAGAICMCVLEAERKRGRERERERTKRGRPIMFPVQARIKNSRFDIVT